MDAQPPDWVRDEHTWRKDRLLVVNRSLDYLEGRAGLIEVSRDLCACAARLRADRDPDFLLFRAIDSETDHLPIGKFREGWAADSLLIKDQEIRSVEEFYRSNATAAAKKLVEKYSG
jgi:hypothetical protein